MDSIKKISSQRHRDQSIVDQKIEAEDYVVTLCRFQYEGETYDMVIDGHHSYEAAIQSGNEPEYVYVSIESQTGTDSIDDWMTQTWMGNDYYDIETGKDLW